MAKVTRCQKGVVEFSRAITFLPEGEIFEDSALFVTEPFIEKKQS